MKLSMQQFALPVFMSLAASLLISSQVYAAETSTPAVLAASCTGCHGPGGKSPGAMPSLAELDAKIIMSRMKEFRGGEVPATVMTRIAKGYSDAEIEALGQFFAKSK